ncbi:MAG: hypothetical protein AVDCRST_MAG29-1813, partial [uncultured Nocardioidaceae bacterium]
EPRRRPSVHGPRPNRVGDSGPGSRAAARRGPGGGHRPGLAGLRSERSGGLRPWTADRGLPACADVRQRTADRAARGGVRTQARAHPDPRAADGHLHPRAAVQRDAAAGPLRRHAESADCVDVRRQHPVLVADLAARL